MRKVQIPDGLLDGLLGARGRIENVYSLTGELINPSISDMNKKRLVSVFRSGLAETARDGGLLAKRLQEVGFDTPEKCQGALWLCVDALWKDRSSFAIGYETAP